MELKMEEIKELILFMKEQKIMGWELGEIKGTFHPSAWQPDIEELRPNELKDEEEEALYYSGV